MPTDTISQAFFENKYRLQNDPWNFASEGYELDRYDTIARSLRGRRYLRGFEPGCSIGMLTERLAALCDCVEAMDIAPSAVKRAKNRCQRFAHVNFTCGSPLQVIPEGFFDLIVLSEIGYYFTQTELNDLGVALVERLQARGTLLAAHWIGHSEDHILSGDTVHEVLLRLPGLSLEVSKRYTGFRLDRWMRK